MQLHQQHTSKQELQIYQDQIVNASDTFLTNNVHLIIGLVTQDHCKYNKTVSYLDSVSIYTKGFNANI
jgi:hypothetical protein